MNITELIKSAIENTAKFRGDMDSLTVEGMIPAMKKEDYPEKYLLDVAYDDKEATKMDIFYPSEGDGPFPVFVEVHGGAWYFGQKTSIEFKPFLHGLERGFACVSLGYTLAPKAKYPQPVVEIKKAINYLKQHSKELNINPDKIVLWGGSAGAHLAALATYSNDTGYLCEKTEKGNLVKMLVLWYGCHNYYLGKQLDSWIYNNFFGTDDLSKVTQELILSNPACHITRQAPYTILQHGKKDMVVPFEQSVYLYNALKEIAGEDRCSLDLVDDCDHADAKLFHISNVKKMFDLIEKSL